MTAPNGSKASSVVRLILAFSAGAAIALLVAWLLHPPPEPPPEPPPPAPEPAIVQIEPGQAERRAFDTHQIEVAAGSAVLLNHVPMTMGRQAAQVILLRGSVDLVANSNESVGPLVVRAGNIEVRTRAGDFNVSLERYEPRVQVRTGGVAILGVGGVTTLGEGQGWPLPPAAPEDAGSDAGAKPAKH